MRRGYLFGLVLVALLVVVGAGAFTLLSPPPATAEPTTCQATLGPWTGDTQGDGAAAAAQLDDEQRGIAAAIIAHGTTREISPRAWQIAIQAGMTESKLRNLGHGDRDSLGIFQMRPSMGWGTPEQLQDVEYQIGKFYSVLETIPGWDQMRPGDAAQKVERSGFPQRYHAHEAMAVFLVSQNGNVIDPSGCGGGAAVGSEGAQRVIDSAMRWLGTPYAWGGGTAAGPSRGIRDGDVADSHGDYNKIGFDCSGLTLHAYAQVGITLPRKSTAQYDAGAHVPVAEARPGDLVFWGAGSGDPATISHVALYLGDGKILEAPQSGDVVKVSELTSRKSGLVAHATRPGV